MPGRRLGAEERALWARVIESVNPIAPARAAPAETPASAPPPKPALPKSRVRAAPVAVKPPPLAKTPPRPEPSNTLDGSWDRRLGKGVVSPDFAVDLHGHTLESAHRLLDASLERAIADGARVVLLITGKAPKSQSLGGPPKRGLIRAAVGDWIAYSRHGSAIAAVRNAHPRHGGAGALYIILKRGRTVS
ncbi:Smr/MutS family protein [Sphingobium boeckii]|nr:Smr/MutS family protein [Sphingobium boeckii]